MNFLTKVKNAILRFMYGRSGVDQLCWALIILQLLLNLLASLIRMPLASNLAYISGWVIWAVVIFRIFSKNLVRRRAENAKFLAWWTPKKRALGSMLSRLADREHKYLKCSCGTWLRVPKGKGKLRVTCPKCGKQHMTKS